MIRYRDYQNTAMDSIFREWEDHQSTLLVCPTGGGKTCVFAGIIYRAFPKRTMVLAHRTELITQARDQISNITGFSCDIEMADSHAHEHDSLTGPARVVISTIQTQVAGNDGGGRMGKFDPMTFGILIVDEAHHACSPSYRRVIDYYRQNPNLKVLGVTATPDRADEEALGQVFESVAFDYEIEDAIHDGWLVPIEQQFVTIKDLDFSNMRTTAGDLNGADLASVMEMEQNLQGMAIASLEMIGNRRAIVFTASVKQAELTSEIFNRARPGMAGWVCGKTEDVKRAQLLAQFKAGEVQVVCNCGVLTEGFDDAGVEVIIMGRPTKSRSLYAQMVGRSTRPLPGVVDGPTTAEDRRAAIAASAKPSCTVLDFVGNSGRHKLITTADILGGKISEAALERALFKARQSGQPVRIDEAALLEEEAIKEERRLADAARRAKVVASVKYSAQSVNPFDVLQIRPVVSRGWDTDKKLSEKQVGLLKKHMGIDPETITFAQGKQLIAELFRRWDQKLASFKQIKILGKRGINTNGMTHEQASKVIDGIAKAEGWKARAA